ncbi:DNA-directed RNA polymerase I subunit RPA1-like [Convolutriloba macropyga]|uniref:DNA-directed RNA polymerase I subunit RPA1-like n=1 Tax=Convolutriloba macropyga TaxID=536237 RepID=UPI003F5280CC
MFFLHVLPVFPPKHRPFNVTNKRKSEHIQTLTYGQILKARKVMLLFVKMLGLEDEGDEEEEREVKSLVNSASSLRTDEKQMLNMCKGKTLDDKFQSAWLELQRTVNNLVDSQRAPVFERVKGVKQMIEKKEGVFRMNMMGKRVNFGARSVITPDPMLATNEVGVPFELANKLSFPEPISRLNMQRVKKLIRNGPSTYPGANFLVDHFGNMTFLSRTDPKAREIVIQGLFNETSSPKTLYRHVEDGDVVLLNRQPTLHKPSIQAHIVRVLRYEKTIRLHYSACKAYNADFDGDEVNMHFPQSFNARSEGYQLMNAANFYLTPKDGSPLGGLIQDHIVGAVHLTLRGTFFTKEEYQKLVMFAIPFHNETIHSLRPTILKPQVLWSGKQIFSTVLQHCLPSGVALPNFCGKSKVNKKLWSKLQQLTAMYEASTMDDSVILVRDGELLQGVIDKTSIGSAEHSFTHCLYELYGPQTCSKFLSACSKLMTSYLQHMRGFTLGVKDVLCNGDAEKVRRKKNKACSKVGSLATAEAMQGGDITDLDEGVLKNQLQTVHTKRDAFKMSYWEKLMSGKVGTLNSELTKACIPYGLKAKFPENNLLMMIESGAKGSAINMAQIAAQNGQIELEGRRIPMQLSGKHLACFKPYDLNPVAGGFATNRFLTGLKPSQYVYHCMAGRDGLVDTAVKTSRSGYLQRCLIKLLEGVRVHYDSTVRNSDATMIQFLFGEDGLDPIKSSYLKDTKTLKTLIENKNVYEDRVRTCRAAVDTNGVKSYQKEVDSLNASFAVSQTPITKSGKKYSPTKCAPANPTITHLPPDRFFGSVSEKYGGMRDESVPKNDGKLKSRCKQLLNYKFMESLMDPGEGIGLITAQSIGEPSTQMTLNTFHFAGRGDVNVTLGIPRLRELLQTASRFIKTPTMTVPVLDSPEAQKMSEKLSKDFRKIYLEDVLLSVNVEKKLAHNWRQQYKVRFNFVSRKYLRNLTFLKPRQVLKYMENSFLAYVARKYERILKYVTTGKPSFQSADEKMDDDMGLVSASSKSDRKRNLSDGASDVEDNPEVGGTAEKVMSKIDDERDYDDEKDAEDVVMESDNEVGAEEEHGDEEKEAHEQGEESIDGESRPAASVIHSVSKQSHDERVITFLKDTTDNIVNYEFDTVKESHCTVTYEFSVVEAPLDFGVFLQEEASKAVLCSKAKGVTRAVVSDGKFVTEGVNVEFISLFSNVFDLNQLYTNSIHHLLEHFGIEAAYAGIIKELGAVFGSYGIAVDRRHLSLVADFMTQSGTIKAFDRRQIASNPSHIQRASFESAFRFLKEAAVSGHPDDLLSPSACISVGKVSSIGTGSFDLLAKRSNGETLQQAKRITFDD